jgi:hypothetical protein
VIDRSFRLQEHNLKRKAIIDILNNSLLERMLCASDDVSEAKVEHKLEVSCSLGTKKLISLTQVAQSRRRNRDGGSSSQFSFQ